MSHYEPSADSPEDPLQPSGHGHDPRRGNGDRAALPEATQGDKSHSAELSDQTVKDKDRSPKTGAATQPGEAGKAGKAQTGLPDLEGATPAMRQFLEIKAANPASLLFYRMGDFYELFFEDALVASAALNITLTKRGKHQGEPIPMCGVPVVRAEEYLHRLIAAGHRVAVCEQLEDPAEAKKRAGSKALVHRDVVRVVTPGTIIEEQLLDATDNNYLLAIVPTRGPNRPGSTDPTEFGLAWIDMSTGTFFTLQCSDGEVGGQLSRIGPAEILLPRALADHPRYAGFWADYAPTTPLDGSRFDASSGRAALERAFAVATLEGFGSFSSAELGAAGALLAYIEQTQRGVVPPIKPPRPLSGTAAMSIDAASRANLELTRTLSGQRQGSLLAAIDRTRTAAGARLLRDWLSAPLTDKSKILERQDAVSLLLDDVALRDDLSSGLRAVPDIVRAMTRLSVARGGPRDLASIRDALQQADALHGLARNQSALSQSSTRLAELWQALGGVSPALLQALESALVDQPGPHLADGGFVRTGHRDDLDSERALRDQSRTVIAELETRYRNDTGIKTLKIKHNGFLGYFIEVNAAAGEDLLNQKGGEFAHRQSLQNAKRFSTSELADLQSRIEQASDEAMRIERMVFAELCDAVSQARTTLVDLGDALAELDVLTGLAVLAAERDYTRPSLTDDSKFRVEAGRHPVVEQSLASSGTGMFVPNDCVLGEETEDREGLEHGAGIWLITGPNMAGKSTFLRQNALIAILAQIGSYVPARLARIGIVDRLFSRVGASDDIARGRSTFMVEMVETAAILNQATDRSFVILDEIGRGTATYDGLSIAWATLEHLHEVNRCRALFATHFHELATLSETHDRLRNASLRVREYNGEIVFLHEVAPGAADRSYGVQVAKLAGLPAAVVHRARDILERLERADQGIDPLKVANDLPLFAIAAQDAQIAQLSEEARLLHTALAELDPDAMTPREALDQLYALRALLAPGSSGL
jgi:DNA mismatch repair protein MutS